MSTEHNILRSSKTVAIVGLSPKEGRPSLQVCTYLKENGYTIIGQGASSDIVVASARALINALNKLEYRKKTQQSTVEKPSL